MKRKNKKHLLKNKTKFFVIITLILTISISFAVFYICNWRIKDDTNWHKDINSNIYYLDNNNQKLTGWQSINNHMYFFDANGFLTTPLKVIDVSKYQGNIDWTKVKNQGISLAMIRSGYGFADDNSQIDPKLYDNIKNAQAAGIKVGVYHYSYAKNEQEAKNEADYCIKAIKGYNIDLQVAYDLEEDIHQSLSNDEVTNLSIAFCERIKSAGYMPMIYSKYDFFERKFIYNKVSKYDLWIAQYADNCSFNKNYTMWQYTKTGLIDGINGKVDFSYYYPESTINKYKK